MNEPIIIPRWLYEHEVAKNGQEVVDRTMTAYNAVAVADWSEAIDPEAVRGKVNRG